jgi:1-acyl-sn-glycerol-3-phosphate acyltransferase
MIRGLCWLFVELMQLFGLYSYQVRREFSGVPVGKLIVANHPMLLDAVFVMAYISNVCCIAKPALARNPFTGPTLRQAGFVLSDDPDLLSTMVSKLHRGENVLLFPEGTRNTSDLELNFRRGAANLAVISGCDVLPVVLECQPRALQRGQKWYQVPAQRAKIRMTICNPLVVNDCVDRALPRTLQYRQFTHILVALYRDRLSKLSVDSKADYQSDSSAVCSLKENVCNES